MSFCNTLNMHLSGNSRRRRDAFDSAHVVPHDVAQRGWASVIRHLQLQSHMHFRAHVTGVALRRLSAYLCPGHSRARLGLYPVPRAAIPLLPLSRARLLRLQCIAGHVLVLVRKMLIFDHEFGTWKHRQDVLRWMCNSATPLLKTSGNDGASLVYDHGDDGGDQGGLRLVRGDHDDDDDNV